jgi:predicted PurR-regulated permease PerM
MVIFMLLERRDLRDRLIGLLGHGHLAITTKAFDEAGTRVSLQLLMQSLVNLLYGITAGAGLYFLGVPYSLVWATLAAVLRFIPYVGPVLGAGAPILVSLAAAEGWAGPLHVVALFVVLELFTNLVLETVSYAGAAGVSAPVALLASVAFWTWLWRPLGLVLATPLTVCLVVLGSTCRVTSSSARSWPTRPRSRWSMAITSACWLAIRAKRPILSSGTSRLSPRVRCTTA